MSLYPQHTLKRLEALEARLNPVDATFGVTVIDTEGVTLRRSDHPTRELRVCVNFLPGYVRGDPVALPEEVTLCQDDLRLREILGDVPVR